jgi:hypothetical protein
MLINAMQDSWKIQIRNMQMLLLKTPSTDYDIFIDSEFVGFDSVGRKLVYGINKKGSLALLKEILNSCGRKLIRY